MVHMGPPARFDWREGEASRWHPQTLQHGDVSFLPDGTPNEPRWHDCFEFLAIGIDPAVGLHEMRVCFNFGGCSSIGVEARAWMDRDPGRGWTAVKISGLMAHEAKADWVPGPGIRDLNRMRGRPPFRDRRDAGQRLAEWLASLAGRQPLVLALPRGGVPVALEVAQALRAPLDLVMVRKIGAPEMEEFGIGAVVDGQDPQVVLDKDSIRLVRPPPGYVEAEVGRQLAEIVRRRALYLPGRAPLDVTGRVVIVVDDGIATGNTARAALRALRRLSPDRMVLAAPVAAEDVAADLAQEADEVTILHRPRHLRSVSEYYANFSQTTDEEVVRLLGIPPH